MREIVPLSLSRKLLMDFVALFARSLFGVWLGFEKSSVCGYNKLIFEVFEKNLSLDDL